MPTRPSYRKRFAQDLRAYRPDEGGTATAGTINTLVSTAWPIARNLDASDDFDDWFLLRPSANAAGDRVRVINPGAYSPRTGTFTVDKVYTNAPVTGTGVDTDFELHGHGFEPWNGIDLLLNAALLDIHIVATIPFVPRAATSGNYAQNLTDGDGSTTVNTKIAALLHPRWVHSIDLIPLAARQVQTLTITNGGATTYSVTYRGYTSGTLNTTDANTVVQTALRLLPGLEAVTVVQTGSTPNFINTVTMTGAPIQSPALSTSIVSGAGAVAAAITTEQGETVPQSGSVELDGNHVIFRANRYYAAGDVLYIRCRLPAYYWCRSSATTAWGSQSGLSAEAHLAQPTVEWVSAAMQVIAWKRRPDLMQMGVEQRNIASQATAQAELDRYNNEFLRSIQYSPILRYPIEGGGTSAPSPISSLAQDVAPATAGRG